MRQFDVFDNPDRELADLMPSVVVLNHDAFSDVPTVLVAPLFPAERRIPYRELCPAVDVLGARMLVGLTDLASIAQRHLGPPVASVRAEHDRILRAFDLLLCGF